MSNPVLEIPPAAAATVIEQARQRLGRETDCWDVHSAQASGAPGFVLLDVRSAEAYARGHVPGALHWPVGKLVTGKLREFAPETVFVVYCAGPHCNGSTRAALRLAELGRPVKEMIGGITGWIDEGFALDLAEAAAGS